MKVQLLLIQQNIQKSIITMFYLKQLRTFIETIRRNLCTTYDIGWFIVNLQKKGVQMQNANFLNLFCHAVFITTFFFQQREVLPLYIHNLDVKFIDLDNFFTKKQRLCYQGTTIHSIVFLYITTTTALLHMVFLSLNFVFKVVPVASLLSTRYKG